VQDVNFAQMAVRQGVLTESEFQRAVVAHDESGKQQPLGQFLVSQGFLSEVAWQGVRRSGVTEIMPDAEELASSSVDRATICQEFSDEAPPETIGRYTIVGLIGRGGMGTVYRVHDPKLDRDVALKLVGTGEQRPSKQMLARFQREARLAARLQHPNLIPVHEVGESELGHYYTMDLVDGPTLSQRLDADPPLSDRGLVEIIRDIAGAVGEAHAAGLVHRDIKPDNILKTPYLTDFGLAKDLEVDQLTRTGMILGTAHFMSPEQAQCKRGRDVGPPSDVWSLGVTLYDGLTSLLPFDSETMPALFNRIILDDPLPPSHHRRMSRDLETIVLCCLEKDVARRYPDGRALQADLQRFLDGEMVAARRAGVVHRWGRWVLRNRMLATVVGVALVALIAAGSFVLDSWRKQSALESANLLIEQRRLAERVKTAHKREALALRGAALDQQRVTEAKAQVTEMRLNQRLWLSALTILDLYRRRMQLAAKGMLAEPNLILFKTIDDVLEENPKHPRALWLHGLGLYLQGKRKAGMDEINRSLELKPKQSLARLMRALINLETLYMAATPPPNRKALLALIRTDVNATRKGDRELKGQAYYYLAHAAYRYVVGKHEEAARNLKLVLRRDAMMPDYWMIKGLNLMALKQYDKASKAFSAALSLGMVGHGLYEQLALAHQKAGRPELANVFWGALGNKRHEDVDKALRRAKLLIDGGQLDKALAEFNAALRRRPDNLRALMQRGMLHEQRGETARARADFERGVKAHPRSHLAWNGLGVHRANQRDWKGALTALDRSLSLRPKFVEGYINRASYRQRSGDYDGAMSDYDKAVKLDPKRHEAYGGRGLLWIYKRNWKRAREDCEKAVALGPKSGRAHFGLGLVLYLQKDWAGAVKHLQTAVSLEPRVAPQAAKLLRSARAKLKK